MGYQTAPNVHLGLCYGLRLLWLYLSTTEHIAWLLEVVTHPHLPPPPSHPPPYTVVTDISESVQKPVSCQLCSYNASYKTSLLLVQVYRGYNQG